MHKTISLNGTWEFRKDPENTGLKDGLHLTGGVSYEQKMDVPSTWNTFEPNYEGVAFYRRSFSIDNNDKGKKVRIKFHAVNYRAEVFVNGEKAGAHDGGYTPFEIDATGFVKPGEENLLVVRVVDPPNDGTGRAIDGLRHMEIPSGKESWYMNFSGIWQDVELIVTDDIYVNDIFVIPVPDERKVKTKIEIASGKSVNGVIELSIFPKNGMEKIVYVSKPMCFENGINRAFIDIDFPEFKRWTLESPYLYRLEVKITADGIDDADQAVFGMRSFGIKDNFFMLNGEKIILRGLLHQQQYPKNLARPETKEDARKLIRLLKDGGWNLLRLHIRPSIPFLLDVCDEEGFLLFEEPAIGWIVESEQLAGRALSEVREMTRRDRNHPSVILWGILNESGVRGAPDIMGRTKMYWNQDSMGVQKIKIDLARAIREEDPSRMITDDSGAVTCNYYLPDSYEPVRYYDNHLYMGAPLMHEGFEVFRNLGKPEDFFRSAQFDDFLIGDEVNHRIGGGKTGTMFFQSEFGSASLPRFDELPELYNDGSGRKYPDQKVYERIYGLLKEYYDAELTTLFPSFGDFVEETQDMQAESAKRMVEALRANRLCAGYVLTQLNDNDYECASGILDPFMRPKKAYYTLKETNKPVRLVLEVHNRVVSKGGSFSVEIYSVCDGEIPSSGKIEFTVTSPSGKVVYSEIITGNIPGGINDCFSKTLSGLTDEPGRYHVEAVLRDGTDVIDKASYNLYSLDVLENKEKVRGFGLVTFNGDVKKWLNGNGIQFTEITAAEQLEAENADCATIVVEPIPDEKSLNDPRIPALVKMSEKGADVIFMELPLICFSDHDPQLQELRDKGEFICWCSPSRLKTNVFPFDIYYWDSKPRFVGPYHFIRRHPLFEGLFSGGMIDDLYAAVLPYTSVRIAGMETIAGAVGTPIGYHRKIKGCDNAMDLRSGADLCVVKNGRGRMLFSTFKIGGHLGKDAAAERIFMNLLTKPW